MSLKTSVDQLLSDALYLCRNCQGAEPLEELLIDMRERLGQPLRVAIVGVMKAGKSTFMNALMGADIVYTGDLETTYTVSWFRYGSHPSLEIYFRDGTTEIADYSDLQKWSVRASTENNPRIKDVKYLIIKYPSEILKKMEFIDTPGLNSSVGTDSENTLDFLAIRADENTKEEESAADAVIYAMPRVLVGDDKNILTEFQQGETRKTAVNAIGILTRIDANGNWTVDEKRTPVEIAAQIASGYMEQNDIRSFLYSLLPVCAKPVEGIIHLNDRDWKILSDWSKVEDETLREYLWDAADFANSADEDFALLGEPEDRKRLLNLLASYGILEVANFLREGYGREEIPELLFERCGMKNVTEVLYSHFGMKKYLIKSYVILNRILARIHELERSADSGSRLKHLCEQVEEQIDLLFSSTLAFDESKLLQMYYNDKLVFHDETEKEDFLHLAGEYGYHVEARLGLEPEEIRSVKELAKIARNKIYLWSDKANDMMADRFYIEAAEIMVRSYEQMLYHLNELLEE